MQQVVTVRAEQGAVGASHKFDLRRGHDWSARSNDSDMPIFLAHFECWSR
jgi:hypothetical protein